MARASLDATDKAIIRELQLDGRLAYAQLGPRVGLSQAATRQRVNRLTNDGIIQVVAVTDPARVGLDIQAMVGVNVSGDAKAIAATLAEIDEIEYVVLVSGRYDILAEVVCRDTDELLDLVNDRMRAIDRITGVEVFTYLRIVKQTYNWGTG